MKKFLWLIISIIMVLNSTGCGDGPEELNRKLLDASTMAKYQEIKKYLDQGANVNYIAADGTPPLLTAVWEGDFASIKILVEHGAHISNRIIGEALKKESFYDSIKLRKIGIGGSTINKSVVIDYLKRHKNRLVVFLGNRQSSIARKELKNRKIEFTEEKFAFYGFCGGIDILQLFLNAGMNVNAKEKNSGRTALHNAASEGNVEEVRFLLNNGADINAKNKANHTPLYLAACQPETVRILLERGADVKSASEYIGSIYYDPECQRAKKIIYEWMGKAYDPNETKRKSTVITE